MYYCTCNKLTLMPFRGKWVWTEAVPPTGEGGRHLLHDHAKLPKGHQI